MSKKNQPVIQPDFHCTACGESGFGSTPRRCLKCGDFGVEAIAHAIAPRVDELSTALARIVRDAKTIRKMVKRLRPQHGDLVVSRTYAIQAAASKAMVYLAGEFNPDELNLPEDSKRNL